MTDSLTEEQQRAQPLLDEIADLRRLLRGTIRQLLDNDLKPGPQVYGWWRDQPEFVEELAHKAALELSDEQAQALSQYVAKHGKLPARYGKAEAHSSAEEEGRA